MASTFVDVKFIAAITTVSDAVLDMIRFVTYLRDPFRRLRRWHKPITVSIAMYRIPAPGDLTGEHFPQGADPRAWSWRAVRTHRVQ